jgi:cation diffusion facilitator family transporter
MAGSSTKVVWAALAGNVLVTLTKFVAAALTGSSAMLSEAIHSIVDSGNELLLLYGVRRAARPADGFHPFGHGREIYFWSFIVALLIFSLGAGLSLYEGIHHVVHPAPIERPFVSYVVIGLALLFESASWRVAFREFRAEMGEGGYFATVRASKDPMTFIVLFEDTAAIIGLLIALAGTAAAEAFGLPVLDGVASILIGVLLGAVAGILARESKGLLIGEPARSEVVADICAIAGAEPGIQRSRGLFTVHIGPRQVLAAISADFKDSLSAAEVEAAVASVEAKVRQRHPEVVSVLITPQPVKTFGLAPSEDEA